MAAVTSVALTDFSCEKRKGLDCPPLFTTSPYILHVILVRGTSCMHSLTLSLSYSLSFFSYHTLTHVQYVICLQDMGQLFYFARSEELQLNYYSPYDDEFLVEGGTFLL